MLLVKLLKWIYLTLSLATFAIPNREGQKCDFCCKTRSMKTNIWGIGMADGASWALNESVVIHPRVSASANVVRGGGLYLRPSAGQV